MDTILSLGSNYTRDSLKTNSVQIYIESRLYLRHISIRFHLVSGQIDPYYIPLGQETSSIMNQMSFFNRTIVSIIYLRYILQVSNRSEFSFKMQIFHNRIPSDIHSIERDIRCAAIQCEV